MASKKKATKTVDADAKAASPTVERKNYTVTHPVVGSIMVFVEAESEEQAVELAFEQQDWRIETGDGTEAGEHWQALRSITRGNVLCAPINDMTVECDDD